MRSSCSISVGSTVNIYRNGPTGIAAMPTVITSPTGTEVTHVRRR